MAELLDFGKPINILIVLHVNLSQTIPQIIKYEFGKKDSKEIF